MARAHPIPIPQSAWIPDSEGFECMKCESAFSCWNRRHHCRFCGFLVCGDCSNWRVSGDRACNDCFKRFEEADRRSSILSSTPALKNVKNLSPLVHGPVRELGKSPLIQHFSKHMKSVHSDAKEAPKQLPKQKIGAIVIVDPFSTGALLVDEATQRGYDVIGVYSSDFPDHIRNLKLPGLSIDFVATIDHKGHLGTTVKAIEDLKFDLKIVVPGCETGVELADAIAEALGLRNNGTALTEQRRNKYLMGEQVRKSGVRAVEQAKASQWVEAERFLKKFGPGQFKMVIKPCSSAGTDGVYLCRNADEVRKHFNDLIGATNMLGSKNSEVVLQEFLEGKEYVVDSVSRDGVHKCVCVWEYDKRPANGHEFVYFGMRLISGDSKEAKLLIPYMHSVLNALGIKNGPSHGEVMMTPTGPCLVEVGARCHGGEGSWVPLVKKCLGRTQVNCALDSLLDEKAFNAIPDRPILKEYYGAEVMLVSRYEGRLKELPLLDKVRELQSFFQLDMLTKPGDKIVKTIDCITRPGSIRLCHKDKFQIESDFLHIRDMEENGFFVVE